MGLKVAKFGGSSLADGIQLTKTKSIITADPDIKYVVVSAPGKRYSGDSKVTDLLYLCKAHIEHNLPYEQVFQVICDRYMAMALNLGLTIDLPKEFAKIEEELQKGASSDYIASRGEYLNAQIIAAFLGYDFVDTEGLILFDNKGNLKLEETNEALAAELSKHECAVLPGFYGSTPNGEIKTFSRGGSDITGSLVARAINADIYENWTDVSGFLMTDPRIVPEAKPISYISYKELRELSYMGASVLHEDAIFPVRLADIPINIRNTNAPQDPGTMITDKIEDDDRIVTGIAGTKDYAVIAIHKNMMATEKGFIRRLLGILDAFDVNIEHIPSGIDNISVVVSKKDIEDKIEDIIDEIKRKLEPDFIDVYYNMALIATVGHGMSTRAGTSATLFTALAEAGVNIRMINQGSSEINIIVGVENKDFETAIKAIYNAFVA